MLETSEGALFFWLADTAWQLMHALTLDECEAYFAMRARQGFSVVQMVVLCETNGIRVPNAMGHTPFAPVDSMLPNAAYFEQLVRVVESAARHGLYLAVLPAWGDKLTAPWGEGPRLFSAQHQEATRTYARFIAKLLAPHANVVWMLGGDRPARIVPALPGGPKEAAAKAGFAADVDWLPIWSIFAEEIQHAVSETDAHATPLILYHPQGGEESTSIVMRDVAWLSVNGMQSGHGSGHDVPVWDWVRRDVSLKPAKPTLDLEPNYEDHPVNPWPQWDPALGFFDAHDVRRQTYRSVFAGACGATYGHHAVWQFASARSPVINHATMAWQQALQRPGGQQMGFLRALMLSRPAFDRVERPEMIVGDGENGESSRHCVACGDSRGPLRSCMCRSERNRLT